MITRSVTEFLEILPKEGKLLGLDYGEARIGIATCDETRLIASAYETYKRRNMSKDMGHINGIIEENNIVGLVMGLPLELDGGESESCEVVRSFAAKLLKKSDLPILLWDERLSTKAVTRTLNEYSLSRRKQQSVDDKLAAAYILQQVIDL